MKVVIRTDASIEIGTGHVVRCMTLARQLRNNGATVIFICRSFHGNYIGALEEEGFNVVSLPLEQKESIDWNKNNWEQDAEDTKRKLKELHEIDLLIVDHYGIDSRWEKKMRSDVNKIMVIDDLANRPHDCDLLLDQNYYFNMKERYKELVPIHCFQMLGPNYLLLRDEFIQKSIEYRERKGEISNLLVFFGGTDPTVETVKTLEAIRAMNIPKIEVNIIVGQSNENRTVIEQMSEELPNVNFYCQVSNMAELMWRADIAIGAGGATTWERCFMGLPSLTIITANNQIEVTNTVEDSGGTICLGLSNEVNKENIQSSLLNLIQTPQHVEYMSIKCRRIINPHLFDPFSVLNNITKVICK